MSNTLATVIPWLFGLSFALVLVWILRAPAEETNFQRSEINPTRKRGKSWEE